jgi:hypothetical protein
MSFHRESAATANRAGSSMAEYSGRSSEAEAEAGIGMARVPMS